MERLFAGLLVGLLIVGACESPPADGEGPVDTTDVAVDDTAEALTEPTEGAQPGDTPTSPRDAPGPGVSLQTLLDQAFERDPQTGELAILDRLNEPRSVSVETQPNTHDPSQTDTLRTRQYAGLSMTVYHVSGGKEILKNLTVTGPQYETQAGLTVGMTRSELESLRGQPDQRQNGTYVYNLGGPMPTMLHISFSGDEVSRMEWQYPID